MGRPRGSGQAPRVLQLFTSLNRGGMEVQTLRLTRGLQRSGRFEVLAAALGGPGDLGAELARLGIDAPRYPLRGMARPGTAVQVARFAAHLRSARVDVIHTHDFYTSVFGLAAAVLAGTPVRIASRRELEVFSPAQRRMEHLACRAAHRVVANCRFLADRLLAEGMPAARVGLLRNSVELGEPGLLPGAAPADWGPAGWGPAGGRLLMVANLHSTMKDFGTLAEAMERVWARHPSAALALVGAGAPSPELRRRLEPAIRSGRVRLAGPVPDAGPWIDAADVCVLSSRSEGLSTAVMEYLAGGRATVASAVGGMAELIEDGTTGLLVPAGDAGALADGILRLLDDAALRTRLGSAGREHMRREFSPGAQVAAAEALYDELLARAAPRRRVAAHG